MEMEGMKAWYKVEDIKVLVDKWEESSKKILETAREVLDKDPDAPHGHLLYGKGTNMLYCTEKLREIVDRTTT